MNTENLHLALQQSFSPDPNLRLPAEKIIKELKHVDGASSMLLQITAEKQVQFEVRQAAAINLKNLCKASWAERLSFLGAPLDTTDGMPAVLIKDVEKEQVRELLLEALLNETEKSIQDLLAETINHIAINDFPDKWPTLLPKLQQNIQHTDPSKILHIHNALVALRKVCKRYEYKAREERGPLGVIVAQFFPILLPLAQNLSGPDQHSIEAALTLKLILKIFYSCTQFFIPNTTGDASVISLSNPPSMQPWFDVLEKALAKPLLNQPESKEEKESWPWWKVKKWATQIMVRLFSRYGIPSTVESEAKAFSIYFSQHAAPQFLGPVCETLNLRPTGQFCPDRVIHLCLSFVDSAIDLSSTYKLIKPHLDFILWKVCFPTICLSQDDLDLFENDPHEFIHKQNSVMNDFVDPRLTAITVIINLVKSRGQDVINGILSFLDGCLKNYLNGSKNHIEKDGCLQIMGALSVVLFKKKQYISQVEPLLVNHVFPEFQSQVSFLRSRACSIIQNFEFIEWNKSGSNLNNLIQLVLQSLSDTNLPVQIEASKALQTVIKVEGADTVIAPFLPQILQEYFRIMNEIGNDEVISALQTIIDVFGDTIQPHAFALISQLATAFSSYCSAGEDDDDAVMAALQCLECISTVLKGICERPDIFNGLEPVLIPIVKEILGNNGEYIEFLESGLEILTFMTFFQDTLSPAVWETFPLIYVAFDLWAFDYLYFMIPVIENFIGKAPQTILNGVSTLSTGEQVKNIELILTLVSKTVNEKRSNETEKAQALSLYMCILHNCKGGVDNYLSIMNDNVLGQLAVQAKAESVPLKAVIYKILGSALHYNPKLELDELERRGVTESLFSQWINDVDKLESWLSQKLTVLGISSILLLPAASLPPTISTRIQHMIAFLTHMMTKMNLESQHPTDQANDFEGEGFNQYSGQENDDEIHGFGEDEDVNIVDDDPYMKALFSGGADNEDFARFLIGDDWANDYNDDDYVSPIDEIDTLEFYVNTLKNAFAREPLIANSLPTEVKESFQSLCTAEVTQKNSSNNTE